MKAIILAAGFSSRMYPLAQDIPKCLLSLNSEENILDRQVRILKSSGINKVVIVTGFKQEEIAKRYQKQAFIFPVSYHGIGNLRSLWHTRGIFDDDLLILNSDVVFAEKDIKNLIRNRNAFCFLVGRKRCNREDQKVKVENRLITEIGKYISLEEAYGEFIGICKIQKRGIKDFKRALKQGIGDHAYFFYPEAFNYLIKEGKKVHFIKTTAPWIEVDTRQDYEKAKELLRLGYFN